MCPTWTCMHGRYKCSLQRIHKSIPRRGSRGMIYMPLLYGLCAGLSTKEDSNVRGTLQLAQALAERAHGVWSKVSANAAVAGCGEEHPQWAGACVRGGSILYARNLAPAMDHCVWIRIRFDLRAHLAGPTMVSVSPQRGSADPGAAGPAAPALPASSLAQRYTPKYSPALHYQ